MFTERTLFGFRDNFKVTPKRNFSDHEDYFPQNYDHSRKRFLSHFEELKKLGLPAELLSFNVPSKFRSDLFVDACFIPNENSEKLVILTTGVHGLEAPAGSAAIEVFINRFLNKSIKRDFSLLLVHCLNPFGFEFTRRATENNVDLNRNFFVENKSKINYNPLCDELRVLLNPQDIGSFKNGIQEFRRVIRALRKNNFQDLSRALAYGQKQFPGGLFYAGEKNEPQTVWLKSLLVSKCSRFKNILAIDIHTGFGERGKLYYFGHTFRSEKEEYFTNQIFSDLKTYSHKDDGFYETAGDLSSFIAELFKGRNLVSMTFELGTVNNHKPFNQIRDFYKLVRENQIFNDPSIDFEGKKILLEKLGILETYSPESKDWRKRAINQMTDSFHLLLDRFYEV